MPINIISSFYIEPCSIYFYHEGMKPVNAGALRFFGGIFSAIAMLCLAIYIKPYPS